MTMWPSTAMIADYLEEWLPDKDGEIHVAFTSKQRDQIVAALRLRERGAVHHLCQERQLQAIWR